MKQKGSSLAAVKIICAAAIMAIATASAETADGGLVYSTSTDYKVGEWNSHFVAIKELADAERIPLVVFWANRGCPKCRALETALNTDTARAWQKNKGYYFVFGEGTTTTDGSKSKSFARHASGHFPYIAAYWNNGVSKKPIKTTFAGRSGEMPVKSGSLAEQFMASIDRYIGGYVKPVNYVGGKVSLEETDGNRLEAEEGTSEISFEMVRDETAAEVATNNIVKVIGPDGKTAQTVSVTWTAGQTNQTVTVDISKVSFSKDGEKALLVAADANGSEQATNTVTYVAGSGESSANPLWIGERSAPKTTGKLLTATAAPALQFGVWTMDLDTAKATAAAAEGDAYTLVSVEGSLWCHDCANTERNFLSVTDKDGNNRFNKWAADNNVALVAIDVPSFTTNSSENITRPTILSRKAIATTLAYEIPASGFYDVSKGGAPQSLTLPMVRSGLGYLTRKGVSDETAAAALERNRQLVTTDFSEGGFHSAADSSPYRTGVPIFVVLDKKGNVAARLTRFASVSPMASAKDDWDNIIKRFDELLAIARGDHSDGGVLENDFPSAKIAGFKANGGSASGEISHVDYRDVFALQDFTGNALLKTTVSGESAAEVTVSYIKLGADGKEQVVGESATGKLSDGIELEYTFTVAGEYFVKVAGDLAGDDFGIANETAGNFHSYAVSSTVVYVPQEEKASGNPAAGSDQVTMRLEKGQMYRIEGLNTSKVTDILEPTDSEDPYCIFYTALVDGDKSLTTQKKDVTVSYQKWTPGTVGFTAANKSVTESAGEVKVSLSRTGGASGDITVKVALDEEATTLYDSDGKARFEFKDAELVLKEGWLGETNVTVAVLDDARFDGSGDVALSLEVVNDENGDTVLATTNFVLAVTEDDKQAAGKAAFVGADPFFSRRATVYARESDGATVYAKRVEASDGYVTVKVAATNGAKTEIGGVETNLLVWANHKFDEQAVKVSGIAAGRSARLTLTGPTDGLRILSASNYVTVVSVADDAPAFSTTEKAEKIYRYVAVSNVYPVVLAESVDASAAKLTFTKLSGTLPAGLTAKYDADSCALAVIGTPTAKAGVYTMVYQVTQRVGTKTTPGLTIELTYTIQDPTVAGGDEADYNEAVAAGRSRTIKDIPVIDAEAKRLAGVLQVTIPQNGRASAKFTCADGAVSFSAKGWSAFGESGEKALSANLASTKKGYSMTLVANNDGSVTAEIDTPDTEETPLVASSDGKVWSASNAAEQWKGVYTVALKVESVEETREQIAPRGYGYLTLKLEGTGALRDGRVTWSGILPNGMSVSGSTILSGNENDDWATLPIYKKSSLDEIALVARMYPGLATRSVIEDDSADAVWRHAERIESANVEWTAELGVYGSIFDKTANLLDCCEEYQKSTFDLVFDTSMIGETYRGAVQKAGVAQLVVSDTRLSLENRPAGMSSISFNKSLGTVSGSLRLPCEDGYISAVYKGVLLTGWGEGCGCSDEDEEFGLPFVIGAFYFTDRIGYEAKSGSSVVERQLSVKRGGSVFTE